MAENVDKDVNMSHNDQDVADGQVNQVKEILNLNKIKLWLPPYCENGISQVAELFNLAQQLSPVAPDLSEDVLVHNFQILQRRALDRLEAKGLLEKDKKLRLKIKPSRSLQGKNFPSFLEVDASCTGENLTHEIAKYLSDLRSSDIRLISAGRVLQLNLSLVEQNIRPGQAVMVLAINSKDDSMQVLHEQRKLLESTKEQAEILGSGNADEMGLTVADQKGNALSLPAEERKALIISMSLHEKGKTAIKRRNFDLALVLLLEADQEYLKVRSELLKGADNYGLLNLDIAWCYVQLGSISQLEDAVARLQKCEQSFEQSYGPNMERVMAVKGSSGSEKALYMRMHLLQAIAFYHSGDPVKAKDIMNKAREEFKEIDVSEEALEELVAFGFTTKEARIALRVTGGRVAEAATYAQGKRDELEKIFAEEEERKQRWKRYGHTVSGKNVNLGYVNTLQTMGFSEDFAVIALRQADNDINNAIDMLQNQADILSVAIESEMAGSSSDNADPLPGTSNKDGDTSSSKGVSKKSSDSEEAARKKAKKAKALKHFKKDVGEDFGETDDYLNITLDDEKELIEKYSNILGLK